MAQEPRQAQLHNLRSQDEDIAKKIRFLMRTEGMTIDQMASQTGVQKEHLRYVVDGISRPTLGLLEKVCATFGVKLEYFGKNVRSLFADELSQRASSPAQRPSAQRAAPRKPVPIGVLPAKEALEDGAKRKRQFDLAELAAHHQALLECLIEKGLLSVEQYTMKLNNVRKRAGLD